MRAFLRLLTLILVVLLVSPSVDAREGTLVFLLPDNSDRYRPAVVTGPGSSVLADINTITPPSLSRDGTRVAFTGSIGDESLGEYALFLVDIDGSGLTQLTDGNYGEMDPDWSPDGQRVAISQNGTGSILSNNCCRLATVDVDTGSIDVLTSAIGVARPSYSPDGSLIVFDTPSGIWKIPSGGGSVVQVASVGYDATVSPDGGQVAYLVDASGGTQLRIGSIHGGSSSTLYSTSNEMEAPHWNGSRVSFFEYDGLGYDGRKSVRLRSILSNGSGLTTERSFASHPVGMSLGPSNDEILFYRDDGLFAFYNVRANAALGGPLYSGSNFSTGWSSISSIDLNGDGSDELLFYRTSDGVFKYYDTKVDATLGTLIRSGTGYSTGWDSITRIDLDGDRQDEIFFYRTGGSFRFYEIGPTASLGSPIRSGSGFSTGWSSITAIDLDGDGSDEMLFYRGSDGTFKYYDVRPDGGLGGLILSGTGYSTGWSSISAIDLDGDEQDEIVFYRTDGSYRYYDIRPNATLGPIIASGSNYTTGWTSLTRVEVDG